MKQHRRGGFHLLAVIGVAAALGAGAPALAQDVDENAIIVTAPYTVERESDGRFGGRGETVSVTRYAQVKGLDLRYDGDMAALEQRITYAATLACEQAEEYLEGEATTTDSQCVRRAVSEAMPQARYLAERARS